MKSESNPYAGCGGVQGRSILLKRDSGANDVLDCGLSLAAYTSKHVLYLQPT